MTCQILFLLFVAGIKSAPLQSGAFSTSPTKNPEVIVGYEKTAYRPYKDSKIVREGVTYYPDEQGRFNIPIKRKFNDPAWIAERQKNISVWLEKAKAGILHRTNERQGNDDYFQDSKKRVWEYDEEGESTTEEPVSTTTIKLMTELASLRNITLELSKQLHSSWLSLPNTIPPTFTHLPTADYPTAPLHGANEQTGSPSELEKASMEAILKALENALKKLTKKCEELTSASTQSYTTTFSGFPILTKRDQSTSTSATTPPTTPIPETTLFSTTSSSDSTTVSFAIPTIIHISSTDVTTTPIINSTTSQPTATTTEDILKPPVTTSTIATPTASTTENTTRKLFTSSVIQATTTQETTEAITTSETGTTATSLPPCYPPPSVKPAEYFLAADLELNVKSFATTTTSVLTIEEDNEDNVDRGEQVPWDIETTSAPQEEDEESDFDIDHVKKMSLADNKPLHEEETGLQQLLQQNDDNTEGNLETTTEEVTETATDSDYEPLNIDENGNVLQEENKFFQQLPTDETIAEEDQPEESYTQQEEEMYMLEDGTYITRIQLEQAILEAIAQMQNQQKQQK